METGRFSKPDSLDRPKVGPTSKLVSEVVSRNVVRLEPGATVYAARAIMQSRGVGHALVVSVTGEVLGIVSRRNLRSPSAHEDVGWFEEVCLCDVMSYPVIGVTADVAVELALSVMRTNALGCLVVYEGARLLGLVTEQELERQLEDAPSVWN
jgi:CBS domain-containing protein